MPEAKWVAVIAVAFLVCVFGSLAVSEYQKSVAEARLGQQCLSSGGEWVTKSVIGNPTNHDCVRKD